MSEFFKYPPEKEPDMKLEACMGHYHLIFTTCGHSIIVPRAIINEFDSESGVLNHIRSLGTVCLECNAEFTEMQRKLHLEILATMRNGGLK